MRGAVLVLALAVASLARAESPPLVQKIEAYYSKAETLKAAFEIETVNQEIGEVELERGEIFVQRPNRMRWSYSDPQGKVLLLDGKQQWLYLPDEGQAFRGEQSQTSSEMTLTLLAAPGTLDQRFVVTSVDSPASETSTTGTPAPTAIPTAGPKEGVPASAGVEYLRLEPRQAQNDFEYVVLGVEPATGKVVAMNVVDSFHNMTRIRFTGLELNPRLSSSIWELKLPRGTELLNFDGEPIKD